MHTTHRGIQVQRIREALCWRAWYLTEQDSFRPTAKKREKILRAIILKTASHHIPSGRHRLNTEPVPTEILEKMRARDDLRSRDSALPALPEMNDEITRITNKHKRQKWRQFVETLDHKTDHTKQWRTIKAIDSKSTPNAEIEAITFEDS